MLFKQNDSMHKFDVGGKLSVIVGLYDNQMISIFIMWESKMIEHENCMEKLSTFSP